MRISRPLALAAGVLICGAIAAGCKAPNLRDRLDDTAEILRLNVGLGPGLLVNAHATRPIAVGVGAYRARRFGFRNGSGWIWDERRYDTNLIIPIWGWEDVEATYYGGMPETLLHGDARDPLRPRHDTGFWRWAEEPLTINNPNRGWLEVSANVHAVFIGVDVGFDVGELLDWLVGWVGLDPAGDDRSTGKELEKHDRPPPKPPTFPNTEILK